MTFLSPYVIFIWFLLVSDFSVISSGSATFCLVTICLVTFCLVTTCLVHFCLGNFLPSSSLPSNILPRVTFCLGNARACFLPIAFFYNKFCQKFNLFCGFNFQQLVGKAMVILFSNFCTGWLVTTYYYHLTTKWLFLNINSSLFRMDPRRENSTG